MQFVFKCLTIYFLTTTTLAARVRVERGDFTKFEKLVVQDAVHEVSETSGTHTFAFSCTMKDTSKPHLHGPEPTTSPARGLVTLNVGGGIEIKANSGAENLPQVKLGWPASASDVVEHEKALGSSAHADKDFKKSAYGLVDGVVGQFCREMVSPESYAADIAMCEFTFEGYTLTPGCPSGLLEIADELSLAEKDDFEKVSKTSGSHTFAFSCTMKDTSKPHLHGPEPTTSPARGLVTLNVGGGIEIKATSGTDAENLPQVKFGWPASASDVVEHEKALGSSAHAYKDFKKSAYGLVDGAVGQFCREMVNPGSYAADIAMCEGYTQTPGCP